MVCSSIAKIHCALYMYGKAESVQTVFQLEINKSILRAQVSVALFHLGVYGLLKVGQKPAHALSMHIVTRNCSATCTRVLYANISRALTMVLHMSY
jgi:hypothetical protein